MIGLPLFELAFALGAVLFLNRLASILFWAATALAIWPLAFDRFITRPASVLVFSHMLLLI